MKRYIFTAFALASIMTCSTITTFAQQPIASSSNKTQVVEQNTTSPKRALTYAEIQSLTYEGDILTSITAKDVKGHPMTYQMSEQTIFLDSGKKVKVSPATLKEGDRVYFYHIRNTIPIRAEAIITNIPMNTSCAHLHTIEAISTNQDGSVTITSDQGSKLLTTEKDVVIKAYDNENTLKTSDLQVGQRFFTWYDVTTASEPAQAGIKHIVILPQIEHIPTTLALEDMIKNKTQVQYQTDALPVVNGVYFVPLRETAKQLDLTITWDSKNRVTKLESDTRTMNLIEGNDYYISSTKIKGAVGMTAPTKLGAAPFIDKTNMMYVPAEAFRVLVGYNVTITDQAVTITEYTKE